MQSDLETLKISEEEIENLSGLEVNQVFIGSIIGGTFRPSSLRSPQKFLSIIFTEISVFILLLVLTIPIGFLLNRNVSKTVEANASYVLVVQISLVLSLAIVIVWNWYMWVKSKRFTSFAHLLDEVDKYNEVIQAVEILDRLKAVGNSQVSELNREVVLEALEVTRESLICGLMTEKILRKHQGFIARRQELFANIEQGLATLQTLEIDRQASEYGRLLDDALEIGMSVRQELRDKL